MLIKLWYLVSWVEGAKLEGIFHAKYMSDSYRLLPLIKNNLLLVQCVGFTFQFHKCMEPFLKSFIARMITAKRDLFNIFDFVFQDCCHGSALDVWFIGHKLHHTMCDRYRVHS